METAKNEMQIGKPETVDGVSLTSRCKYLVFQLGNEHFGVTLSSVKEVIGLTEITEVPQVPNYFKGLINLRGKIISVLDLRLKLKLPETDYMAKKTSIIISEIKDVVMGVIVDDVEQVASYATEQIENSINIQSNVNKDYLQGVAKTDGNKLVLLINIHSIIGAEELAIIKNNNSIQS